jgi:choice-of-anchor C domain-containing protein
MKTRPIVGAALAVVASISMAGSVLSFSGVTNGSFETGTFSSAPWDTLFPGNTNLTGWTIESGSVDWTGSYWPASEGSRSIDLSGNGPGVISQSFATTAGNTYTVNFDLSGNPACGPAAKTLTVSAAGAATDSLTYDILIAGNSLGDMKWVARQYSFVATSSSTALTFTSTTTTSCGPALDNIVVTETVPVPPTLADCKDAGWLTMIDADRNGFKNQGDCVSYFATDGKNPGSVTPQAAVKGHVSTPSAAGTERAAEPRTDVVKAPKGELPKPRGPGAGAGVDAVEHRDRAATGR